MVEFLKVNRRSVLSIQGSRPSHAKFVPLKMPFHHGLFLVFRCLNLVAARMWELWQGTLLPLCWGTLLTAVSVVQPELASAVDQQNQQIDASTGASINLEAKASGIPRS